MGFTYVEIYAAEKVSIPLFFLPGILLKMYKNTLNITRIECLT